jgi:hypothetical protein
VLVDWTSDLPKDDSEIERPLNQIIAAVEKSARRPAKIEGCPRFPARKTVDILRSMGYDVVSG